MRWHKKVNLLLSFALITALSPIGSKIIYAKEDKLIPMGHSISIQMDLTGLFLTSDLLIKKDEWLKSGDLIKEVNKQTIRDLNSFIEAIGPLTESEKIELVIDRKDRPLQLTLNATQVQRLMPFLKDQTDGTGTLTYVDPERKHYGALGHQIIDNSLKSPPSFKNGSIRLATIEQIRKSTPGNPGYKISSVVNNTETLGTIQKNIVYGIFGKWEINSKQILSEPLQVMKPEEINLGPAQIFTTINGTTVEKFAIQITEVKDGQFHFILTDQKLLEKTGGILQGMSGSPIIQNGKFAGAITHMFVDEPEKGAAIFMHMMRRGES